jgi:hypothetical protein
VRRLVYTSFLRELVWWSDTQNNDFDFDFASILSIYSGVDHGGDVFAFGQALLKRAFT